MRRSSSRGGGHSLADVNTGIRIATFGSSRRTLNSNIIQKCTAALENDLQRQLKGSRAVGRARHLAEVGAGQVTRRSPVHNRVEHVEYLRSQLCPAGLPERKLPEHRQVHIPVPV